ncbi:hypothetical protein HY626_00430 [Candidatus Uhrbacteria bacterium]|nr:hypothetical protein [Candidatus Uhrbacteria bacterium]
MLPERTRGEEPGVEYELARERERGPIQAVESLRKDTQRMIRLHALWDKFAQPPESPLSDITTSTLVERDIQDAMELLRAPEVRLKEFSLLVIDRLVSFFSAEGSLQIFLTEVVRVTQDYFFHFSTVSGIRQRLRTLMHTLPVDDRRFFQDGFIPTKGDPFGVLDPDVRDETLLRIVELPAGVKRLNAVLSFLTIDANACLQQIDRFELTNQDRETVFRAVAVHSPDVLPPYLPFLAEQDPHLARDLLSQVVEHSFVVGVDAITRFPLTHAQRGKVESQLIASHPRDFFLHFEELSQFLTSLSVPKALEIALSHLESNLPEDPVERLHILDSLTQDDTGFTDEITPIIRRALGEALKELTPVLEELRRDIAQMRQVPKDQVSWSFDLLDTLSWELKTEDQENARIRQAQQRLGSSRVRPLLLSAFAVSVGESPMGFGSKDRPLSLAQRRVILEEALEAGQVNGPPPDEQAEWTGWGEFAYQPRSSQEAKNMRVLLDRLVQVSPTDFVIAWASQKGEIARAYKPILLTVAQEHLENALHFIDVSGQAIVFANMDLKTTKWLVDKVFGSNTLTSFHIPHIPQNVRPLLRPYIERYRKQEEMPYAAFPDVATALYAFDVSPTFASQIANLPESERLLRIEEFSALMNAHPKRGIRALQSLGLKDEYTLRRGILRTIGMLLDRFPDAFLDPKPEAPVQPQRSGGTSFDEKWHRMLMFIPFCPPERFGELVGEWEPWLKRQQQRRETWGGKYFSDFFLMAFRLHKKPQEAVDAFSFFLDPGSPVIVKPYELAHAVSIEELFALTKTHGDEMGELLGNPDTRGRIIQYLKESEHPKATWEMIRRFADSYRSMIPEADRRAKITSELVLKGNRTRLSGSIRYATVGSQVLPVTHVGVREAFVHPQVTDGRLELTSLTKVELERVVRDRLQRVFTPDINSCLGADAHNRDIARQVKEGGWQVPAGTLIHYTSPAVLPAILAEGNCCGETIGIQSRADSFPLFVDVLRVRDQDGSVKVPDLMEHPEYHENYGSFDKGVALVYPRRCRTSFFPGEEKIASTFGPDIHHLVFVGIPHTELGVIVLTNAVEARSFDDVLERTKTAVVKSGVYVPIVRASGDLLFTPEEYDKREAFAHPYATLEDFFRDATAFNTLDRPQPSAVHEFTLKEHLLAAERNVMALSEDLQVPFEMRDLVRAAARLHDVGKFDAVKSGQEIANVIAAERELNKVRGLDPEWKRRILVLIHHDELLGDILKGTSIDPDGTMTRTPEVTRKIQLFHDRFPSQTDRLLLRVLYEADVLAIGNNMYQEWQIQEKLRGLEFHLSSIS